MENLDLKTLFLEFIALVLKNLYLTFEMNIIVSERLDKIIDKSSLHYEKYKK